MFCQLLSCLPVVFAVIVYVRLLLILACAFEFGRLDVGVLGLDF